MLHNFNSGVVDATFLCEFDAGRAPLRQRTRHRLDATFLRRQKIFTAMPAEVVEHCASTGRKFENEFAHFLAEKLRNLRAEILTQPSRGRRMHGKVTYSRIKNALVGCIFKNAVVFSYAQSGLSITKEVG